MSRKRRFRRLKTETLERRDLLAGDVGVEQLVLSEDDVWAATRPVQFASPNPQVVEDGSLLRANDFKLFILNQNQLADTLVQNAKQSIVSIPTPEGEFQQFSIAPSQVMSPELSAKFREIKTFAGNALDGSGATVRVTSSPTGFHAQVFSQYGDYYVDPYFHLDDVLHASYRTDGDFDAPEFDFIQLHDHGDDHEDEDHQADEDGHAEHHAEEDSSSEVANVAERSGTQLRTYRLAVATTGEYATFHGGTVASAMAAVVTAVTRVSGIYESELSIRLQLIPNNDALIYTNAGTDPYSNNDDVAMLGENQANVDNVIGSSNYDIGHVFSTSGGGVAGLGVVGFNGAKARGTTGLANPIGDPFYVDYVAHEVGHQFGGDHTFNGDSGNCAGGNRNGSTAYEPGSGSTIQAYAGICGNDNLQPNSDPYFHFVSFDQIIDHVDDRIPGVGTRTATGNSVPTVDAGNAYTIPARTPFALTATGSDGDAGDVLTYTWEQRDLGPQQDVNAGDNGSSPIFRSWEPTTEATRTFPRLSDLLSNTTVIGETLPTTNRDLNFRVTVRDNRMGGGGVNTDDVGLVVVDTGSSFQVTVPNTAVSWPALSSQEITWDVAGTTANGINAANVDILLSTDGGLNFDQVLASAVPNDGSHFVTVPNDQTTTARIKVMGSANVFFDLSNTNFSITESLAPDDFGDAPASYGTLLVDDGARHTVGALRLGLQVDTEPDAVPSAGADSDGADEDGVSFIGALVAGETGNLQVTASGPGVLDFFADFNGDGVFQNDSTEKFNANIVAGVQTVPLAIPASSTLSLQTRFRFSTAGGLGPTGSASDGEVEDHLFAVFAEAPPVDFGDAPSDQYATLLADNGARHSVDGTFLGNAPSSEADAVAGDATATSDSDDGVTFRAPLSPGSKVDVDVQSTGGVLDYFVDFNGDGVFGDTASEVFSATIPAGASTVPITVPANAVIGTTFARFRISQSGGAGPTGLVVGGEVEDYQVAIRNTSGFIFIDDFDGDVNFSGDWQLANTGSNSWIVSTSNSASAPNHAFVADIASVSDASLTSTSVLVPSSDTQLVFQNHYDTEEGFDGGVLEISIDGSAFQDILDAGGSFESGGYVSTISSGFGNPLALRNAWSGDSSDFIQTVVNLPAAAVGQQVRFSWRMGTDSSVDDDGWHVDSIELAGIDLPLDFGDAAGSAYPTLAADSGAAHFQSDLFLGTLIDVELDGQPTAAADGDDFANADDEDGVSFPADLQGGTNTINVVASASGILNAWLDFDGDGDWLDAGEQIIKDLAVDAGANDISIELPELVSSASRTARFRLSTQSALAVDGFAADGEVEDYQVTILPPIPDVSAISLNAQEAQRSLLTSIEIPFDTEVVAPNSAFEITQRESGAVVGDLQISHALIDSKTVTTITFGTDASVQPRDNGLHSLVDGNYELKIIGSQVNAVIGGTAMPVDFVFGDSSDDKLYRFFGDHDADRDVDVVDLNEFGDAFRSTSSDINYDPVYDSDGDGDVDVEDLDSFGQRFRTTLSF